MSWTAQAEVLAAEIREPGFKAAAVTASAWRAGVHAEATHGLVGAALALTDGEATGSLWAQVEPCPKDAVLLEHAAELEGAAAELLAHARRAAGACRESLTAAADAACVLARAATSAEPGVKASAEEGLAEARAVIADCEAALEILGDVTARLEYALKCLRQVPDDFAQHYETPLAYRREQGPLPVSGAFLTAA